MAGIINRVVTDARVVKNTITTNFYSTKILTIDSSSYYVHHFKISLSFLSSDPSTVVTVDTMDKLQFYFKCRYTNTAKGDVMMYPLTSFIVNEPGFGISVELEYCSHGTSPRTDQIIGDVLAVNMSASRR